MRNKHVTRGYSEERRESLMERLSLLLLIHGIRYKAASNELVVLTSISGE